MVPPTTVGAKSAVVATVVGMGVAARAKATLGSLSWSCAISRSLLHSALVSASKYPDLLGEVPAYDTHRSLCSDSEPILVVGHEYDYSE